MLQPHLMSGVGKDDRLAPGQQARKLTPNHSEEWVRLRAHEHQHWR
jgi:hypothetical protein